MPKGLALGVTVKPQSKFLRDPGPTLSFAQARRFIALGALAAALFSPGLTPGSRARCGLSFLRLSPVGLRWVTRRASLGVLHVLADPGGSVTWPASVLS